MDLLNYLTHPDWLGYDYTSVVKDLYLSLVLRLKSMVYYKQHLPHHILFRLTTVQEPLFFPLTQSHPPALEKLFVVVLLEIDQKHLLVPIETISHEPCCLGLGSMNEIFEVFPYSVRTAYLLLFLTGKNAFLEDSSHLVRLNSL